MNYTTAGNNYNGETVYSLLVAWSVLALVNRFIVSYLCSMANCTTAEYCGIHFFYGAAFGNALEGDEFPRSQLPKANTFSSLNNRLLDTRQFKVIIICCTIVAFSTKQSVSSSCANS